MNHSFLESSRFSARPIETQFTGNASKDVSELPPLARNTLLSSAVKALNGNRLDPSSWHQKMGQVFGYDPSESTPQRAESEHFRNALMEGDWDELGIKMSALGSHQMAPGSVAAFVGGDSAFSHDDRIVINETVLNRANRGDPEAKASINTAVLEELFHFMERKLYSGQAGDMRFNEATRKAEFMKPDAGTAFDEGAIARDLLLHENASPYHGFEHLRMQHQDSTQSFVTLDGHRGPVKAEYSKTQHVDALSQPEAVAKALDADFGDFTFRPDAKKLEELFTKMLGLKPSDDAANSDREKAIFDRMSGIRYYTFWEARAGYSGRGEAGAAMFRGSTMGKDFARWSLRSDTGDGNGARPEINEQMGMHLSHLLLKEQAGHGAVGIKMSGADQQWYLDNWILPNEGLGDRLVDSLSIPLEAVASLKASSNKEPPELPADAGPLVEFFDRINTYASTNNTGLEKAIEVIIGETKSKSEHLSGPARTINSHSGSETENETGKYSIIGSADFDPLSSGNVDSLNGLKPGSYDFDKYGNIYSDERLVADFVFVAGEFASVVMSNDVEGKLVNQQGKKMDDYVYVEGHGVVYADKNISDEQPVNVLSASDGFKKLIPGHDYPLIRDDGTGIINDENITYDKWGNISYESSGKPLSGAVAIGGKIYTVAKDKIKDPITGIRNLQYEYVSGKGAVLANTDLPANSKSRLVLAEKVQRKYSDILNERLGIDAPPEELRIDYSLQSFGSKAPEPPDNYKKAMRYTEDILTDLGYKVSHGVLGGTYISGHGLKNIEIRIGPTLQENAVADYVFGDKAIDIRTDLFQVDSNQESAVVSGLDPNALLRARIAKELIHELSHAKQHVEGFFNDGKDDKRASLELAAYWQAQDFMMNWLKSQDLDYENEDMTDFIENGLISPSLIDFDELYGKRLIEELNEANVRGVNDEKGYLSFLKD